jgi:hypothetical protein
VEGEGFEPSKPEAPDLQSGPFDRSGIPPATAVLRIKLFIFKSGAGNGTRTRNLLITNQLLYQLSYASAWGSFREVF